jgi:hypothetical protein
MIFPVNSTRGITDDCSLTHIVTPFLQGYRVIVSFVAILSPISTFLSFQSMTLQMVVSPALFIPPQAKEDKRIYCLNLA